MTGGSFKVNTFTVAWPTGEFGAWARGAVRLASGRRWTPSTVNKAAFFDEKVEAEYRKRRRLAMPSPSTTRSTRPTSRFWLASILASPLPAGRDGKKRAAIDAVEAGRGGLAVHIRPERRGA